MRPRPFLFLLSVLFLSACSEKPEPSLHLNAVSFSELPAWGDDDFEGFVLAFERSCTVIKKRDSEKEIGLLVEAGTYGDWQNTCEALAHTNDYKSVIEKYLQPYEVRYGDDPNGLFTGYYEASLKGSREQTARYNIPLYRRPNDLVMVQLGDFREELKGQRIAGRVVNGRLKPFESRTDIVQNPPQYYEPLIWVDDAVDAFFVQIQGSGVVEMDDGSVMRIGYDGQNGHPYFAIGRELIDRGKMDKEDVSMQSIRTWLEAYPDQADDIMNTNASYVFFKEIEGDGPIGGQGVALTPLRSLAIDHTLIPYGTPLWVDIDEPKLQRLMIAQDTGGAIRGAVRGDVFWGFGEEAEQLAGHMNSTGRYWVLLPKKQD
jgi:membrane-bound lytic murein transglycosylase A